jgi:hypothetical protein
MRAIRLSFIYGLTLTILSQGIHACGNEEEPISYSRSSLVSGTSLMDEGEDEGPSPIKDLIASYRFYSGLYTAYDIVTSHPNFQSACSTMVSYLRFGKEKAIHGGCIFFRGLTISLRGLGRGLVAFTIVTQAMSSACHAWAEACETAKEDGLVWEQLSRGWSPL